MATPAEAAGASVARGEEEPPPFLPVGDRGYLACRECRLVLTEPQFLREGCPLCNTGPLTRDQLLDATSMNFTNFIGLIAPEKSWVARQIGCVNRPNGVFAATIEDADLSDVDDGDADEDDVASDDETGALARHEGKLNAAIPAGDDDLALFL